MCVFWEGGGREGWGCSEDHQLLCRSLQKTQGPTEGEGGTAFPAIFSLPFPPGKRGWLFVGVAGLISPALLQINSGKFHILLRRAFSLNSSRTNISETTFPHVPVSPSVWPILEIPFPNLYTCSFISIILLDHKELNV